MASDFEKWVLGETLTAEIAECLLYEARQKLEKSSRENFYKSVFDAFLNLGRVKDILGDSFEEVRQELYEKAKAKLVSPETLEIELKDKIVLEQAASGGLTCGVLRSLPAKMSQNSIHYGFVAEMFTAAISGNVRYVRGVGWEVWSIDGWRALSKERGIVGLIYDVMEQKIRIWRKALGGYGGVDGWLEKLEKNINDPDWLSKVEELILRVDYFGAVIVSDEA